VLAPRLMTQTLKLRNQSDVVLPAGRYKLANLLGTPGTVRPQFGMRLVLVSVIDLCDDGVDANVRQLAYHTRQLRCLGAAGHENVHTQPGLRLSEDLCD